MSSLFTLIHHEKKTEVVGPVLIDRYLRTSLILKQSPAKSVDPQTAPNPAKDFE